VIYRPAPGLTRGRVSTRPEVPVGTGITGGRRRCDHSRDKVDAVEVPSRFNHRIPCSASLVVLTLLFAGCGASTSTTSTTSSPTTNAAPAPIPGQGPSSPAAISEALNTPHPNAIADWTGESVRLTHSGSYAWNTATKVVPTLPNGMSSGQFAVEGGHAFIAGFQEVPVTPALKTTPAPGAAIDAPAYWHVTFSVSQLRGSPRLVLLGTYMSR
jgi:hypothetical protein